MLGLGRGVTKGSMDKNLPSLPFAVLQLVSGHYRIIEAGPSDAALSVLSEALSYCGSAEPIIIITA